MYKKVLFSIVCLCLGLIAKAADTDISQYDNVIYGKKLTAMAGSSVKLSVMLNNNVEVPNLQFDIDLPSGVTIAEGANGKSLIELSSERLSSTSDNTVSFNAQADGSMRIMITSQTNSPLIGNEGEIVIITLNISDELIDGDYPITIRNTVISDKSSGTYKTGDIVSTLTVGKPEYTEGYSVLMPPTCLAIGNEEYAEETISVNANNSVIPAQIVEFDIVLPVEWYVNNMLEVSANTSVSIKTKYTIKSTTNNNGIYHISVTAKNEANYIGNVSSVNAATFTILQSGGGDNGDYSIPTGIYPIQITNIVATDADGNKYYAAPTTTYVKVGEPTEGEITLEGHVTENVATALANETSLTKIDMSKVVSIDGTLTLRDRCDLIAPKYDVEVEKIVYQRNITNMWGTICLPYAVKSNEKIQYYKLKSVGKSIMTFSPISDVEAGTPAVFKLLDGTEANMETTNATLKAGDKTWIGEMAGWEMKGTYNNITLDPSTVANDIFYIANNKFYYANVSFAVDSYRGWFETPKANGTKSRLYSIGVGEGDTTDIEFMEKENGEVDMIFDISGKQMPQSKRGINIINNKKILVK